MTGGPKLVHRERGRGCGRVGGDLGVYQFRSFSPTLGLFEKLLLK